MRKSLLTSLICMCAFLSVSLSSNGQATLIHYWNFNQFTSAVYLPAVASLAADFSIHDTAKARVTWTKQAGVSSAYSTYCDFVAGDLTNARMGDTAGNGFRARNPSDSMQLLFYVPSVHYQNLSLKYACQSSSVTSGMLHQLFSYSVDSGATWITSGTGLSKWTDSAWTTYNLISVGITDAAAKNNPKLVFRITFSGNDTGSKGNNRFDNLTLEGDSIISGTTTGHEGIGSLAGESAYRISPNPASNAIEITSELEGPKSITISNSVGQQVYMATENGKTFGVNISQLSTGNYFISIADNGTGAISRMRFTKQ